MCVVLSGGRQLLSFTNSESSWINTEFAYNIPAASRQEDAGGESPLGPTVNRQLPLPFVCVFACSSSACSPARMSFLRARTLTVSFSSLILLSREELAKYCRIHLIFMHLFLSSPHSSYLGLCFPLNVSSRECFSVYTEMAVLKWKVLHNQTHPIVMAAPHCYSTLLFTKHFCFYCLTWASQQPC